MGWSKLAVPKCKGGLGFRNLQGFNVAMLGKVIWRFCHQPDSLVARIFKARYFPSNHILQATEGSDSSFVWKGIWEAKECLKKGFRWVLGDGRSIHAFKDQWIPGKMDFCVEDNHSNVNRNEKACFYFRPNSKDWDVQKIEHDFSSVDSRCILRLRIPQRDVPDRVAWTGSSKGIYTVKTGYKFWTDHHNNMINSEAVVNGWNKLWKLHIPHKLRVFLWRVCKNNIPVRWALRSKGVNTTFLCPMCGVDVEHVRHLFCECQFARECWQALGVDITAYDIEDLSSWLLDLIERNDPVLITAAPTVLASIWFARNRKVWENKVMTPSVSVEIYKRQVAEWREANQGKQVGSQAMRLEHRRQLTWVPPEEGRLKLNVDAAVSENADEFSVGLVVRNDAGRFRMGKVMKWSGKVSVLEAESRGVCEAVKWAMSCGLDHVVIESDALVVVQACHSEESYQTEVGHIVDECKELLITRGDYSVKYISNHANKGAHWMARVPCLLNGCNVFESPPGLLVEMVPAEFAL